MCTGKGFHFFLLFAECEAEEDALASTLEALAELPPANKDTLAFLVLHLQRVASRCDSNKMPLTSLAKIFGPNIVGHATAHPKDNIILRDTEKQPKVMMRLLGISGDYWRQYMSEKDHPEPPSSPSPSSVLSPSPGPFRSPATPELRPGQYGIFCLLHRLLATGSSYLSGHDTIVNMTT